MWSWGLAAATGLGKGRWISCTSGESPHGRTASYLTPSGFEVQVCCHKHLDGCYRICSCFLPVGLKDESIWSSGLPSTASQTWGSFRKKNEHSGFLWFCRNIESWYPCRTSAREVLFHEPSRIVIKAAFQERFWTVFLY